jgi:hypothetical protein
MGLFGGFLGIALLLEAKRPIGMVLAGVYLIAILAICGRMANARLMVTDAGVRISNIFSSTELRWEEIERFEIGRWQIFPYVCLIRRRTGEVKHAFAIQERTNFPDGSGERMAEQMNGELHQRT